MTDQNGKKQPMNESSEEDRLQELIDGVTRKGKKKIKQSKPKKGVIKKVFKEYQSQFLITIIAIVVIIVLLTISYKTNPYINDNQEESMVAMEVFNLIEL